MTWYPSDAWRDSYDRWKLATPPEYECEDTSDEDEEPRDYAYEAWMRGRRDRASGIAYLNPPSGIDRTEWQNGWRDEDKIIKADDDEPRF